MLLIQTVLLCNRMTLQNINLAQVIIFCLYFALQAVPIFCQCFRQRLYSGMIPKLPIVTQFCVFSQSRHIHPVQFASHAMLPLRCNVPCELWKLKTVTLKSDSSVSHITTRCCDHQNSMCAVWSQDNEIDQACIRNQNVVLSSETLCRVLRIIRNTVLPCLVFQT